MLVLNHISTLIKIQLAVQKDIVIVIYQKIKVLLNQVMVKMLN